MKHFLILGFVSVLTVALSYGDIPQVMSYQGLVTDNSGNPVTDGSYTMRFRIYDAETGGMLEWDSGDRTVSLSSGVFNVRFGESPFPILNLSFDEDYWLEVTFEGDQQLPRTRVASVGYAFMASGIVPGTEVSGEVSSVSGGTLCGFNTRTSGNTNGLYGTSMSDFGRGVYGVAVSTDGYGLGVYGVSKSTAGIGVRGLAESLTGTNYGVLGATNSTDGTGVRGAASATQGFTKGVYGVSASTDGIGVYGIATATTGYTYGVYGKVNSNGGCAGFFDGLTWITGDLHVNGTINGTPGTGVGDISEVNAGIGLDGGGSSGSVTLDVEVPLSLSADLMGEAVISGENTDTDGRNYAIYGESSGTHYGTGYGGYFISASESGVGVYGEATVTTTGVTHKGGQFEALGNHGRGVHCVGGEAGGYFEDDDSGVISLVAQSTYKIISTGTVSFMQNHPEQKDRVIVYAAPEGDEAATYTRGTARLKGGEARVPLGETFKWVTNPDVGLTAHLTPRDQAVPLAVASLTTEELVVRGPEGGPDDVTFDYLVYGLRIGFEDICIVQSKKQESPIPSMKDHEDEYAQNPDLKRFSALERFRRMQSGMHRNDSTGRTNASALLHGIGAVGYSGG